jgi:hypothetical protein
MDKFYTVFVSSTFTDLREERRRIIGTLIGLNCIPVGMEYFPASDESAWDHVSKLIDVCDFFIVISAGRYGSRTTGDIGFTDREFEYAQSKGIPILAFLREDFDSLDADKKESTKEGHAKLVAFRDKCRSGRLCKFWNDTSELIEGVSQGIHYQIADPNVIGWVRSNMLETERLDHLEESDQSAMPHFSESELDSIMAEAVKIQYACGYVVRQKGTDTNRNGMRGEVEITLSSIFAAIAPSLQFGGTSLAIGRRVRDVTSPVALQDRQQVVKGLIKFNNLRVTELCLDSLLVQFRKLGLIMPTGEPKEWYVQVSFWKLTQQGETYMTRLHLPGRSNAQ